MFCLRNTTAGATTTTTTMFLQSYSRLGQCTFGNYHYQSRTIYMPDVLLVVSKHWRV